MWSQNNKCHPKITNVNKIYDVKLHKRSFFKFYNFYIGFFFKPFFSKANKGLLCFYTFRFLFVGIPKIKNLYIFILIIYSIVSVISSLTNTENSLDLVLLSISNYVTNEHLEWNMLTMSSGDNSGGGNIPGNHNNNSSGGGGNGGGSGWEPFDYSSTRKENGRPYRESLPSPAFIMYGYDPRGDVPPATDRQVGVLMDYRFGRFVRDLGYNHWNVANTFPSDSIIDKLARARLQSHILGNMRNIPSTYKEMDITKDNPSWDSVRITSHLINSLYHSNN
jgi:hypothetical protein